VTATMQYPTVAGTPTAATTTVPRPGPRRSAEPRKSTVDSSAAAALRDLAGTAAGTPAHQRARSLAIQAWLPLARHLAHRFNGRGEPLDDLVQIATIGLIKAVDRFNPDYGSDFTAYAVPTIVGEIKRHFRDHTWDIRVPRRLQELKIDLNEATATLSQTLGRSPGVDDLATYLQRSRDEIVEGMESSRAYSAVSLQTLIGTGEDSTELGDMLGADDPDLELTEFRATLGPALDTLPEREQRIVLLRFFHSLTQTQIAEQVGVSQMHVSRLLTRSLAALREQLLTDD